MLARKALNKKTPHLESNGFNQDPEIEIVDWGSGSIRYLEHGYPNELVRWHSHKAFELHLIICTRGKIFVGDHIGTFEPGNLVLTGPHLPHNWISSLQDNESVPIRDRVIQFDLETFENAYSVFPELRGVSELLERAKNGIEFFGGRLPVLEQDFINVRDNVGLNRLSSFFRLLDKLQNWKNYRQLNTLQINSYPDDALLAKVNTVVTYLSQHFTEKIELEEMAGLLKMNPSYFSRFFHKTTGHRFSDFLNRLRVSRACDLLTRTQKQISEICYEVGYNNISNFNRRFFCFKNMTPTVYREHARKRIKAQQDSAEIDLPE